MQIESLNHFKSVTVHKFFVAPADNDYVIARWLLINGFYPECFWHANQAIEKYLKAGLLLNGHGVATDSHDILSLYRKHVEVYGDLAFSRFTKPDELSTNFWREGEVEGKISEINRLGQPSSRYGLTGWYRQTDDLFKLDQICWSLRRLSIGLGWIIGKDFKVNDYEQTYIGKTYSSALETDASYCPRGEFTEITKEVLKAGETRSDLLHIWNYEFERHCEDLLRPKPKTLAPTILASNSYLGLYWENLTAKDSNGKLRPLNPDFENGMAWLLETIKLPREVKSQFREQLKKMRGSAD